MNRSRDGSVLAMAFVSALGAAGVSGCFFGSRQEMSRGDYIDDLVTASRIKEALHRDPEGPFQDIQIDVTRGIVILTGSVGSPLQKLRVEEIARKVEGVKEVRDQVAVRG